MKPGWVPCLGAVNTGGNKTCFQLWAPRAQAPAVRIFSSPERRIPMRPLPQGRYSATIAEAPAGTRYVYDLGQGKERPDPASRFQPEGVHGPSEIVDTRFAWTDDGWHGIPLSQYIIYELHVGTFTPDGTFDAAIKELHRLVALGVTAVELMPVAQFAGNRNWGYDGVDLFAPQSTYGGYHGLKRFVDACHAHGLAVVLDVVYNHLGPEGNYLHDFGPYFTNRYHTPWGEAINFDGPHSDSVREFFVENALYWVTEFHIDALRLDAVHAIFDQSATPFLSELSEAVHRQAEHLNRRIYLIAESDAGNPRFVRPLAAGGLGLDAFWSDDFHHSIHAVLTGERSGYYHDFGTVDQIKEAWQHGMVYKGQYSDYRNRRHGADPHGLSGERFVVCIQNHDQVGNRMLGERLDELVDFERRKLAVGALLLAPFVPLLFMGEEYGETARFPYFVSHNDPQLVEAVREGRKQEFASFGWQGTPPDPQNESTFLAAKLNPALMHESRHAVLFDLYRTLIRLRKTMAVLADLSLDNLSIIQPASSGGFTVLRRSGSAATSIFFNFSEADTELTFPHLGGKWEKVLASSDSCRQGPGNRLPKNGFDGDTATLPPDSFALYRFCTEVDAK